MTDRTRGITYVTPLDLSTYMPAALKAAQEAWPEAGFKVARTHEYALAVAPNGTHYLLNRDGVGWRFEDHTIRVFCTATEEETALMPAMGMILTADEVDNVATGEAVDLADWIDPGEKRDLNHAEWMGILTGEPDALTKTYGAEEAARLDRMEPPL